MRCKQLFGLMVMVFLGLLLAAPLQPSALAAEDEAAAFVRPDPLPEWWYPNEVDAEFVKQHIVVPRSENVYIFDARPYEAKYVHGYVPTAYNLPPSKLDNIAEFLPANKDALLIFYCGGYHCKLSHKAAFEAEKLGYKHVKVYAAGEPDWRKQGYTLGVETEYVRGLLAEGKQPYLLVDSRPHNKFLEGHIPSAISISDTQFADFQGLLPADKGTLLIFYCGGFNCVLSHKSADKARALGYTNIVINESGYPGWEQKVGAGGAVALDKEGPDGFIDPAEFQKILAEKPDSIQLIDVRDPDEFSKGHVPGAVNLPVDKLEAQLGELKGDKPIVFVCTTGARSGEAFYMLLDKRPDLKEVYFVDAEIEFAADGSLKVTPHKK